MKKVAFLLSFLFVAAITMAQETEVTMTQANNGGTYSMVTYLENYFLVVNSEGDGSGKYTDGPYNRWITIDSGTCEGALGMSLYFNSFDIDPGDTLFIHDGPSINSPVLLACNNNLNPQINTSIFPSPYNACKCLTIRFKTNGDGNTGSGFSINVACRDKCETITPVIDSFYYKTRNGVIIDTAYTRTVIQIDTNWNSDSSAFTLDTQFFKGIHLCLGEGLILSAHGEYTNHYGYGPSDVWSLFEWNLGNGDDTSGICLTKVPVIYRDLDCYDVTLRITDSKGCRSTIMESARVRIAQNPIKTIYDLNPICTTDSSIVNIGYEGGNATISMRKISFNKAKSRSLECRTFLPDGTNKNCPDQDNEGCFRATISFDDFPSGRTVNSPADICSICINHEHSWIGDYNISIICPTQQKAALKYGNPSYDHSYNKDTVPAGTWSTSSLKVGIPYGGSSGAPQDNGCTSETTQMPNVPNYNYCDSLCNMYGEGYDYCFSRNGDYMLNRGEPCNTTTPQEDDYFSCPQWTVTAENHTFQTIPAPFAKAGQTASPRSVTFKQPSDHEKKEHYYLPATNMANLIGCPLNGDWSIQVCDPWGGDNGWIFSWSLDFCGISSGSGCEYQVGIDSVLWLPDSNYGDFDLGYWRGLNIEKRNPTRSIISAHDTAGYFPINVRIYDEFGCIWDTTTGIWSVWSPTPELGDDILLCDIDVAILDAKDPHTDSNYTFAWEPFGQKTDTIHTQSMMGSSTLYTTAVTHQEHGITCETRDSVRVNINHQPLPNFDPGIYPLEGCEPYTIHFENTSQYGDNYFWDFGDGETSTAMSPTHTYGTGQYNFRYIVSSDYGCKDSLVYQNLITVYSSPVAQFSWEPMNPTVMHPSVTFHNLTIPQSDDNRYYWEIQYDRDNHISYHTLTDVNPTFEWTTDGEDISGNYIARLIAMTQNMGPSGRVVECRDTIENSILMVNDFLQFPNAVTPNGDGINDKFIVRNLIEGLGYPNNSLAIYDRWGKRVFYKENISKEEDFWDPSNVPTGTYFWRFTGKGYLGDIQRNGVVEVIR